MIDNILINIIIICVLFYIIHTFIFTEYEHMTTDSNIACQNVASVYNTGNMTVSTLHSTSNIINDGNMNTSGIITSYANIGQSSGGSVFGHSNQTQAIGLGYNTIYAAGSWDGQDININSKPAGGIGLNPGSKGVAINGDLTTTTINATTGNISNMSNLTVKNMQFEPTPRQIQSKKQKEKNKCLSVSGDNKLITNENCNSNSTAQYFYWMGDNLVNQSKKLCVSMPTDKAEDIKLEACDSNAGRQLLFRPRGGYGVGINSINNINSGKQLLLDPDSDYAKIADGWSCNTNTNTTSNPGHDYCFVYEGI